MATIIDPAGKETRALFDAAAFARARVLEVGSGDGRLALRYADVAGSSVGIESSADEIATATATFPPSGRGRLRFVRGSGVMLPFRGGAFDIAVFGWAL